jgi:drug/metabolite transporter (DMT)-like permease
MRRAILLALAAGTLYAFIGALTKVAQGTLPSPTIAFFRQAFALMILLPTLRGTELKPVQPKLLLLRAAVSQTAIFALMYALKNLTVSDALVLSYTRPLWIPLLLLPRQAISRPVGVGLLIGFAGVACILKPAGDLFHLASLAGLASGFLAAWVHLLISRLNQTESPQRILLYHFLLTLVLSTVPLILAWQPIAPLGWLMLASIAAIGLLYQFCLTHAYRSAPAPIVGGLLYSAVVAGCLLDMVVWHRIPDLLSLAGILLVACGSFLAIRRQEVPA